MKAIVVVDQNWAIGKNGKLLARLPKDLLHFKRKTLGNFIVMGSKTFEGLPGGKPLPDREHIVMSLNTQYKNKGVKKIVNSTDDLLSMVEDLKRTSIGKDVFICGGGEIYKELLPFVNEVFVTKIRHEFDGADTFFPDLDELDEWEITQGKLNVFDRGFYTDYLTYRRSV